MNTETNETNETTPKVTIESNHTIPAKPPLRVTGAALRSVQAADAEGRAAHQAVVEVQLEMAAHHASYVEAGSKMDATWAAQALRLLARRQAAANAVWELKTRWKAAPNGLTLNVIGGWKPRWYPTQDWVGLVKGHADTLAEAGVPPISDPLSPEAWDDAAARGC